jgi:hypothetical protein
MNVMARTASSGRRDMVLTFLMTPPIAGFIGGWRWEGRKARRAPIGTAALAKVWAGMFKCLKRNELRSFENCS